MFKGFDSILLLKNLCQEVNRFVYSHLSIVDTVVLWKLLHHPRKKRTGIISTSLRKYFMIKGLVKWMHF